MTAGAMRGSALPPDWQRWRWSQWRGRDRRRRWKGSGCGRGVGGVSAVEGLEDLADQVLGNAGAGVAGIAQGVAHEVGDGAEETVWWVPALAISVCC